MLIISTNTNLAIPYHDKIINKYKNTLNGIHQDLIKTNPTISGSFAVNTIYAPDVLHEDLDLYFHSQRELKQAQEILTKLDDDIFITDNAVTFNKIKVQLIKLLFNNPVDLIYDHDLINFSCAITADKVYTTKETHFSWYNQELSLRRLQLKKKPKKTEILGAIINLLNRITKYMYRYSLNLSNNLKRFLFKVQEWLEKNKTCTMPSLKNPTCFDYYGRPVEPRNITAEMYIKQIKTLLEGPVEIEFFDFQ